MTNETGNWKLKIGNWKLAARRSSGLPRPAGSGLPVANIQFPVSNSQLPVSNFQFRIWRRALTVKRPQAAVAMGSLLLGAVVSSTLLNLYADVRRKMTYEFAAYGPNVVLAPAYVPAPWPPVVSATSTHSAETGQSEWWPNLMDESVLSRLETF